MARPTEPLGFARLQLQVVLSTAYHEQFGIISSFASADLTSSTAQERADPHDDDDDDDDDELTIKHEERSGAKGVPAQKLAPKEMKVCLRSLCSAAMPPMLLHHIALVLILSYPPPPLPSARPLPSTRPPPSRVRVRVQRNAARMKRLLTKPYLLRRPYVFALVPLHALVSFHFSPWHLPFVAWVLMLANGILSYWHMNKREVGCALLVALVAASVCCSVSLF
jgi:hypothetical protein